MLVHSPKTKRYAGKDTRVIPIFPEIRVELEKQFEQAEEGGSPYVIDRYRDRRGRFLFRRFFQPALALPLVAKKGGMRGNPKKNGPGCSIIYAEAGRTNCFPTTPRTSRPTGWVNRSALPCVIICTPPTPTSRERPQPLASMRKTASRASRSPKMVQSTVPLWTQKSASTNSSTL